MTTLTRHVSFKGDVAGSPPPPAAALECIVPNRSADDTSNASDDALVYEASTDSDDLGDEKAFIVEEAPVSLRATWAPVMYKRPIAPLEGQRYCPPAMAGSSIVSFHAHNILVLFGGVVDKVPNNNTWTYSLKTKRWHLVVPDSDMPLPEPRSGHSTAAVNEDEMILFGGANISATRYYNDIWLFNVRTKVWTQIEPAGEKPSHRWASAVASFESRIYVHGGESPHYEVLSDLHVYDHDPYGLLTAKIQCPASHPSPELYADYLRDLLYSDMDKPAGVFRRSGLSPTGVHVVAMDVAGAQCVALRVTVSERVSGLDFALLSQSVAMVCGVEEADLWGVASAQRSWLPLRTVFPAPPARMLHAAVVVKDSIVIVGGSSGRASGDATDSGAHTTWVLEARSLLWRELHDANENIIATNQSPTFAQRRRRKRDNNNPTFDEDPEEKANPFTQTKHLPSPFHVSETQMGSLTGHTACAYHNMVLVYGGKLDGKVCGEPTWALEVSTGRWSVLELEAEREVGRVEEAKPVVPGPRWRHCATAIMGIDHTTMLKDCRTITPSQHCYPLGRDSAPTLRAILAQEKQDLKATTGYIGLLVSKGSVPHLVRTITLIVWGGQTPTRKTSEMWQLTLESHEKI